MLSMGPINDSSLRVGGGGGGGLVGVTWRSHGFQGDRRGSVVANRA